MHAQSQDTDHTVPSNAPPPYATSRKADTTSTTPDYTASTTDGAQATTATDYTGSTTAGTPPTTHTGHADPPHPGDRDDRDASPASDAARGRGTTITTPNTDRDSAVTLSLPE